MNEYSIKRKDVEYFLEVLNDKKFLQMTAEDKRKKNYGELITYSKNVFLPIIKLCRNSCAYCGFSRDNDFYWLSYEQTKRTLTEGKKLGCKEALIVSGDKPEKRYSFVREFYQKQGVRTTVEFASRHVREAVNTGFLPHVNLGVLSLRDWQLLKPYLASAGLMLETTSYELLKKGKAHYASPDKVPKKRIDSIATALKLRIPFTTGILLGIGESMYDRIETLLVIKELYKRHGFIQEVIIQPFHPLANTPMRNYPLPSSKEVFETIALARIILPVEISVQVPPNLLSMNEMLEAIKWGANDLGGISPLTKDFVNFEYPWPKIKKIERVLNSVGLEFKERLAVYPGYYDFVGEEARDILQEFLNS